METSQNIITQKVKDFLIRQTFINIATCNSEGRPNVAPKFLLQIDENSIYLADYVIGATCRNLKINKKVSLSTVDIDTLTGYQINGSAAVIEKGPEYDAFSETFRKKQIQLCVSRIVEGVHKEQRHRSFETSLSESIAIIKIEVNEIVEIIPTGEIKRKHK